MSSANVLFFSLLALGPMVSVSSSNWVVCWAGVELSFLGLIPLMFSNNKYMSLTKESSMKYFCIQAVGSALLFYGGLTSFSLMGNVVVIIFLVSLFIKLGVFPIHFWVPSVVSGLDWVPMFALLTFQKVAPFAFFLILIPLLDSSLFFLVMLLGGFTSVVGGLLGINQTDLRAMLGSSSIAHSGWLILGSLVGNFWVYFGLYFVGLSYVFSLFIKSGSEMVKGLGVLSLSGLPPFIMFIGKWGVLKSAVEMGSSYLLLSLFLLGAVISLCFYLKFCYSFILQFSMTMKLNPSKMEGLGFMIVNVLGVLFFFII